MSRITCHPMAGGGTMTSRKSFVIEVCHFFFRVKVVGGGAWPHDDKLKFIGQLILNAQLLLRQHRGHSLVLPAAHWSMHAPRAWRSFLGARTADVDVCLNRVRRRRCSRAGS